MLNETTDAEWKGKDDIQLSGTATDDKNTTTALPIMFVGEFNDHDEKVYDPARVLKTFPLSGAYPKTFLVLLTLAERDSGGFAEFIYDLVNAAKEEIDAATTAADGSRRRDRRRTVGGPVGALIGAVGVALVSGIIALIGHIAADESGVPLSAAQQLGSPTDLFANGTLETFKRTMTFEDYSGRYTVTYSWAITR